MFLVVCNRSSVLVTFSNDIVKLFYWTERVLEATKDQSVCCMWFAHKHIFMGWNIKTVLWWQNFIYREILSVSIVSNIYICPIYEIGWMRGFTIFFYGGGGGWVCRRGGGFKAYFRLFYYVGFRKFEVFREGVRIPLPQPTSFRSAHGLANLSEFLIDPMLVI